MILTFLFVMIMITSWFITIAAISHHQDNFNTLKVSGYVYMISLFWQVICLIVSVLPNPRNPTNLPAFIGNFTEFETIVGIIGLGFVTITIIIISFDFGWYKKIYSECKQYFPKKPIINKKKKSFKNTLLDDMEGKK